MPHDAAIVERDTFDLRSAEIDANAHGTGYRGARLARNGLTIFCAGVDRLSSRRYTMVDPNRTPSRQPPDIESDLDARDRSRSHREPPSVADDRGEGIRRQHQTDDDPALEDEDVDAGNGIDDEGFGRSDR
jgi:hypothetical protein